MNDSQIHPANSRFKQPAVHTLWRYPDCLNQMLFQRSWLLPIAVVVVYGFSHTDFKDYQVLTHDPFKTLVDPGRQFLHSSPLIFFLGWPVSAALGGNASYLLVTLLGFLALAASLVMHIRRIAPGRRATAGFIMLSAPILLVLLRWTGKSDPFVIALYITMLGLKNRPGPTAVCAALMILAHREIGTVVLVNGLIVGELALVPVAIGALAGHCVVAGYQSMLDPKPQGRVSFAVSLMHSAPWQRNPVLHLMLGPGWFWLFIARLMRQADAWRIATVLLLCYAAAIVTADYTRVFVLCAVPLIVHAADRIAGGREPLEAAVRWPALFLLQAQIEGGDQVRDAMWWSS